MLSFLTVWKLLVKNDVGELCFRTVSATGCLLAEHPRMCLVIYRVVYPELA